MGILDVALKISNRHATMYGYDIDEMSKEELKHTIYLMYQYYERHLAQKDEDKEKSLSLAKTHPPSFFESLIKSLR